MLRPGKHSHPDRTAVNAAVLLLVRLQKGRIESFDTLKRFIKKQIHGGDVLFLPALNLLFLLGLVEYRRKTDAIEYVGPNEAV